MALVQGPSARPVSELPCCSSLPSCSYAVPQPRFSFTNRRQPRRAAPVCRCSATTPAQLDSARLQENGVGKAQAGKGSSLHQVFRLRLARAYFLPMLYSSYKRSCCTRKAQRTSEKRDKGDQSGCYYKHRRHRSLQSANPDPFPQSHARCKFSCEQGTEWHYGNTDALPRHAKTSLLPTSDFMIAANSLPRLV